MSLVRARRLLLAGLLSLPAAWPFAAQALDPGTYAVQCAAADGPRGERGGYVIKMDMVDLLTLKNTFGTVISGVRQDDGRRVILTGDHGCALVETANGPRK